MEDFILTLIIEFSIKSYVYPEIFSSAQKISLKRLFESRVFLQQTLCLERSLLKANPCDDAPILVQSQKAAEGPPVLHFYQLRSHFIQCILLTE